MIFSDIQYLISKSRILYLNPEDEWGLIQEISEAQKKKAVMSLLKNVNISVPHDHFSASVLIAILHRRLI